MDFQHQLEWLVAILFLLSGFGLGPNVGVHAMGPTGGGELYNFFRVWRSANTAFGIEQTVWAWGGLPIKNDKVLVPKKGSSKDGTLNAPEWLAARSGKPLDLAKVPPGMDLDNPSLAHFVKYSVDAGYAGKIYTSALMGWKNNKPGQQPGWPATIQKFSEVLTTVHGELERKAATTELESLERSIRDTISYILTLRRSDMVPHLSEKMSGRFPGLTVAVDEKPFALPNVPDDLQPDKKIRTINWEKTVEDAKKLPSKPTEQDLRQWAAGYGNSPAWDKKDSATTHYNAVREWTHTLEKLEKLCK